MMLGAQLTGGSATREEVVLDGVWKQVNKP